MFERWANPGMFNFLWLAVGLMALGWFLSRRDQLRLKRVLGEKVYPVLADSFSKSKRKWRQTLELVCLTCLILGLARPQSGESKQKVKSEGVEVMLLVDVSQSMLAEDVRPSRLELTKQELTRFLEKSSGHKIGIVAFAGSAVVLSPLTTDRSAIQMFIEGLSPIAVSTQGTDFRRALIEAKGAFERGGVDTGNDGAVGRLVVVVSDGEDNEKGAMEAASDLAQSGVRIFTLGVGTDSGGTIPLFDNQGQKVGSLQDGNGAEVVTRATFDSLKKLAEEGRGSFYPLAFGGNAVESLLSDFDRLQKTEFDAAEFKTYGERYQIWAFLALIALVAELLFSVRRKQGRLWRGRFEVKVS